MFLIIGIIISLIEAKNAFFNKVTNVIIYVIFITLFTSFIYIYKDDILSIMNYIEGLRYGNS